MGRTAWREYEKWHAHEQWNNKRLLQHLRQVDRADDGIVKVSDGIVFPILSASHLIVCKAIFNCPQDWVDIDAVLGHGSTIDAAEVVRWVGRIAGDEDARFTRIAAVLTDR